MSATALVDTNVLVYRFDPRFPRKQTIADELLRLALRGVATYQLSCFDAHMWAYAERFGLDELVSEDFQHGRMYGTVQVTNPFATSGAG